MGGMDVGKIVGRTSLVVITIALAWIAICFALVGLILLFGGFGNT
jgi:hypothetical protein